MALDVIRYSGDLKIATAVGGTMTFDTGVNTGTVVITGNLDVRGSQTSITSTNTNIKDNILILNSGETNGYVTLGQSGIGIDRGNRASSTSSATLLFDDTKSWSGIASTVTNTSTYRGVWGLSVANVGSALEVAAIRLPTNAPNDFAGRRSLNFLGRGANAVLSVSGQTNYASRVIHDDDIPNKAYVDNSPLRGTATTALSSLELRQGDTSIVVSDDSISGQPSRITTFIDGVSTMVVQGGAITLGRLSVTGGTLRTTTPNTNLILQTSGTGTTVVNNGISIGMSASAPLAEQGVVKLYTIPSPGAGGTGILFKTIDTGPNPDVPVQGELISARKALVFSIIF
jgi:hypothetical protein